MLARRRFRFVLALFLLTALASLPALALRQPDEAKRFETFLEADPAQAIGIRAVEASGLEGSDPLREGWDGFKGQHQGGWKVWLDERSGLPTLAYGRGIAWVPGRGNDLPLDGAITLDALESLAREFVKTHETLLGSWDGQLTLDRDASGPMSDSVWQVVFRQSVNGVPVEEARFDFQVSHGNLVAFGTTRWGPVRTDATPLLDRQEALAALAAYLDVPSFDGAEFRNQGSLALVPLDPSAQPGSAWEGARGLGYDHRLAWRFEFVYPGEPETWIAKVDARDGGIVALFDDTKYERVKGGVYPVTNDGSGPEGTEQPGYPMPFVDYSEDGGPDVITGDAGLYQCNTLGSTINTNLNGPYVRINDVCGAVSESITCDDELDLGMAPGIDCNVQPGSSPGNTGAARSCFYHVNRVKQLARTYLPANTWLQNQLVCRSNVNSTCNATYSGQLNMYRDGGSNCRNTGENQGVVVHEWGHGMDSNDGGGTDNPGEAYADVVAVLYGRISCVGPGFFKSQTCSGYGDTCISCTGIRDMDWDMREAHTPATPSDFETNNCPGGGSPCGKETHCAAYVPGESIYDLAARDLPAAGLDADTAWQLTEDLFYGSRQGSGGPTFNCSLPDSDGCGTQSWFHKMRLADDDDGDLANGTPHAAAIFAAFDRHDIACGAVNDQENQDSSSCPSLTAPTLTLTARSNAVDLSWTEVTDAAEYRVLRGDIGCDRSQVNIQEVTAPTLTYLDDELGNDFAQYYRVQAIGSNAACRGPVSNCASAAPQPFAGSVRFDHLTYGCGNRIGLQVRDANVGGPSLSITIWSDTEAAPETVVLTESEPGSARYVGEIFTTGGAPASDGLLSTTHDDTITAEYVDADDGAGGFNVPVQRAALSDCVFPQVSGVQATGVTDVMATISWLTDEGSDSAVVWSDTPPPTQRSSRDEEVTSHGITLTGLQGCTVYYYQVESTDPAGNVAVSDNNGLFYRFETLGDFGSGLQPCHAGQISIGGGIFSCSDTVGFEVVDIDLNLDSLVADTVTVTVSSTTETDPETVVLTETGPNTSIFAGSIATVGGAPTGDGLLQTQDGGVITATYNDADDGAGFPAVSFAIADLDCGGPGVTGLRVDTLTNARGTVRFTTSEPASVEVEYGFTPSLGGLVSDPALRTGHNLVLNQFDTCDTVYMRVTATDTHGNATVADNLGSPFHFDTYEIPGLYWRDNFEGDTSGWTLEGEWEVGEPQGLGGSSGQADPNAAYNNLEVLGTDLSGQGSYPGDYEPNVFWSATTPQFDASAWTNTKLLLTRKLSVSANDTAAIYVWRGLGTPIWGNQSTTIQDATYQPLDYDISGLADGSPQVAIQFQIQGDATGQYSGWNIDDVILKDGSLPDYGVCGSCTSSPSFAGAESAVDSDACGGTGVLVSWDRAVAWGSGGEGTYSVYRDTVAGFTPSGANRVATGVAGLSYNDTGAPMDVDLYYLVEAENAETCSTGPSNGGVTDGNTVYLQASDDTTQPLPGSLGGSLRVDKVNQAHVRLSWDAATSAVSYHVLRSGEPNTGFAQIADEPVLFHEDLNQVGEPATWFYLVRGANACGQEGP